MKFTQAIPVERNGTRHPNALVGHPMIYTKVCFECRLTFAGDNERCSSCRRPLVRVSKMFKTPKRTDLKQWARLRRDYARRRAAAEVAAQPVREPAP